MIDPSVSENGVDIGDTAQLSNMAEDLDDTANQSQQKASPTVPLKDLRGTIHKSILVHLLNESSTLSKDGLMRVRQSNFKK